jgi:hypothetical protein
LLQEVRPLCIDGDITLKLLLKEVGYRFIESNEHLKGRVARCYIPNRRPSYRQLVRDRVLVWTDLIDEVREKLIVETFVVFPLNWTPPTHPGGFSGMGHDSAALFLRIFSRTGGERHENAQSPNTKNYDKTKKSVQKLSSPKLSPNPHLIY